MTQEPAGRSAGDTGKRFYLVLSIVHPTLGPKNISEALGMEAHVAHRVGDPRKTPKGTPLSGAYADTRWRRSVEHTVAGQWFAEEVTRLVNSLEAHKVFFSDIKSTGGTASIVIQFMDGFLADEVPLATLAKLVDLELSLGIECFTDV